jgi:hypothetical protein
MELAGPPFCDYCSPLKEDTFLVSINSLLGEARFLLVNFSRDIFFLYRVFSFLSDYLASISVFTS